MIFLIIQTIKENTNHSGLVEMIMSSSVLSYLLFRKLKRFKKFNRKRNIILYFILGLTFLGLEILLSSLMVGQFFLAITAILMLIMFFMAIATMFMHVREPLK
jgi:hypothetical protein